MIVQEFDPNLRYRYIQYGRMSSKEQNPRSPEQQFDTIGNTLSRVGYPWVHVDDYRDDGISGRYVKKRTGFSKMLLDIRTHSIQVDLILVDTLERFGRMEDLETIQRELRTEHGVFVVSAETNFANPTGEAGRALELTHNMRATFAGRVKAHEVKRGKTDSARRMRWPGGPPPLGLLLKRIIAQLPNGREDIYSILVRDADRAWIMQEIFRLAYEKGWGGVRIAKNLNKRTDVVAKVGKLDASTIHRMLGNEIYIGTLVFGKTATDVINDRRVVQAQPPDKWVRVEGFCEALIDRQVFDDVQRQRKQRSAARQRKQSESDKLVKPVSPGMILNYPLSGLVRCADCRAAMRPNASGAKSRSGRRYVYYRCPLYISGRCKNNVSLPEDWLREAVMAKLRSRLFPLKDPNGNGTHGNGWAPSWLPELVTEIRQAWADIHRHEPDRRPALEKERCELEASVGGWTQSLAKPDLSVMVRGHLEGQMEATQARCVAIDGELQDLVGGQERLSEMIDDQVALKSLARLANVMKLANPTALNIQLAHHIDTIEADRNRRVVMRTCRLGVFEGLEVLLAGTVSPTHELVAGSDSPPLKGTVVTPRQRARLRHNGSTTGPTRVAAYALDIHDPDRFASLDGQWFWEDHIELPTKQCWSEMNAGRVLKIRQQSGWSLRRLSEELGKSIPTIRRALKIASERLDGE